MGWEKGCVSGRERRRGREKWLDGAVQSGGRPPDTRPLGAENVAELRGAVGEERTRISKT